MSRSIRVLRTLAVLLMAPALQGCCSWFCTAPAPVQACPAQKLFTCDHPRVAEIRSCVAVDPSKPAGSCFQVLETDTILSDADRAMIRGCVLGKWAK